MSANDSELKKTVELVKKENNGEYLKFEGSKKTKDITFCWQYFKTIPRAVIEGTVRAASESILGF